MLIIVFTGVGKGLRLGEAIFFWKMLKEYGNYPQYIAISGGFWLLAAVFLLRGIWLGKTWSWAGVIISTVVYGVWYWFDRLALQVPHANWPFALAVTVLLAVFFVFILLCPKTRAYFNIQEPNRE